jgi:hypothetical protein
MARTCCPQYTIRLDAQAYKPSKRHRQVVNRFNRFLEGEDETGEDGPSKIGDCDMNGVSAQGGPVKKKSGGAGKDKGKDKGKGKATPWDFMTELRKYEVGFGQEGKHRFEVSGCEVCIPIRLTAALVSRPSWHRRAMIKSDTTCTSDIKSPCTRIHLAECQSEDSRASSSTALSV